MNGLVSINGKLCSPEEAMISVYDRGFLFGDGIYEVTRSYGKILFGLEQHIDRLYRSANGLSLEIGITKEELIKSMYELCKKADEDDIYIRLQISRGNCAFEQISLKPSNTGPANIVMYLHKLIPWKEELYKSGIDLSTSPIIRNTKNALDPNIKSGNYLNNILAILHANHSASDVIMLNQDGMIVEGTTFNIFIIKDNCIYTQPDESDILHGITRTLILNIAENLQIPVKKELFNVKQLIDADEVFVSSSTKEVMSVKSLDGIEMKNNLGPITKQLMSSYKELVNEYLEKAKNIHPWT